MPAWRGLVSGVINSRPACAARRCAPAFIAKVSSLQVNPASQISAGTGPCAACGGRDTPKRIGRPTAAEACSDKTCTPPNDACSDSVRIFAVLMRRASSVHHDRTDRLAALHQREAFVDVVELEL